jgi:chloramphenicol O-acetyltransferase type B
MIIYLRFIFRAYKKILCYFYTLKVKVQAKSSGQGLTVNGKSSVTTHCVLGNNVNFNGMRIDGLAEVVIGDNFHSGFDCLMISSYHNYDTGTKIPYDETYLNKPILVGENVWIGSKVIILGGVTIGEGAIIQAGSVVVSDIPKYAIAGGSPARVFKYRNVDHYLDLKEKKQFH